MSSECEKLLDRSGVAEALDCSERMVTKMVAQGRFPKPLKIGVNSRWRLSTVENWIREAEETANA